MRDGAENAALHTGFECFVIDAWTLEILLIVFTYMNPIRIASLSAVHPILRKFS